MSEYNQNFTCGKESIMEVVQNIILQSLEGGWETLSSRYLSGVREAKESTNYIFDDELLANEKNTIEFIGSLRKVFIDYIIKNVITKLDDEKYRYSNLLEDGKYDIKKLVRVNAFGSTNLTSDYDLTIAGPGVYLILRCLLEQFQNLYTLEGFRSSVKITTAQLFDSNFYVVPDLVLTSHNKTLLDDIGVTLYSTNPSKNMYIQIPSGRNQFAIELESIRQKLLHDEDMDTNTITKKYQTLMDMAENLDIELYSNNTGNVKNILKTPESLLSYTLEMCRSSIEAYYGLSTILVVVYGLQAKKMSELMDKNILKKEHFIIAGVENTIDLVKHQSNSYKEGEDVKNTNLAIKVSKYIQRILTCVKKVQDDAPDGELDKAIELTNKILYYRSNSGKMTQEERISYQTYIKEFMSYFSLDKRLVFNKIHPLFRRLQIKTENINTEGFFTEKAQELQVEIIPTQNNIAPNTGYEGKSVKVTQNPMQQLPSMVLGGNKRKNKGKKKHTKRKKQTRHSRKSSAKTLRRKRR
jgi:hypothetical protein